MSVLDQILSREDTKNTQKVWQYFIDLTAIPRQSGHEEKVVEYLIKFAKSRGLLFEKDSNNNILIEIPGTSGHESDPGYILQSHMDMVCIGEPNPAIHGVQPRIDGDWLKATNTTLGADNGIGVALSLALVDMDVPHAPFALMFTVDEEYGLTGALNMSFANPLTKYKYLINLDSEDINQATVSCAGGGDTVITLPFKVEKPKDTFSLKIDGLPGGHSGDDIDKNHPNGIKMAITLLKTLKLNYPNLHIISFTAGQARNAIPDNAQVELSIGDSPSTSTDNLLSLLDELPHGVIKMSQSISNLVETSTNLATVTMTDDSIIIGNMTRSSVFSDIDLVRDEITSIAKKYGATFTKSNTYQGWPANPDSVIVKKIKDKYRDNTGKDIEIIALHAGLECGAILAHYPHLDAISLGPTVKDVHSINESLHIPSIELFFTLLKSILC